MISIGSDTGLVIVHGTNEFERWLDHVEEQEGELAAVALALLQALVDLPENLRSSRRRSSGCSRPDDMSCGGSLTRSGQEWRSG
jgi:hypothetical protein